ncbi:MAG: hypothetical protein E4H23_08655 [Chrysiogenales bacterium]|nr:MAG: hypothetical protein E4H23_08655 [Chrysiogenales bacterium]
MRKNFRLFLAIGVFLMFLAAAQALGDQAPAQDYDWQKHQEAIWGVFAAKQARDIAGLEREKIVSLLAPEKVEPYMKYFERGLESGTGMILIEGAEQRWLEIAFQSGFRCKRLFEQGYLEGQAAALMAVNDIHGKLSRQSVSGENK